MSLLINFQINQIMKSAQSIIRRVTVNLINIHGIFRFSMIFYSVMRGRRSKPQLTNQFCITKLSQNVKDYRNGWRSTCLVLYLVIIRKMSTFVSLSFLPVQLAIWKVVEFEKNISIGWSFSLSRSKLLNLIINYVTVNQGYIFLKCSSWIFVYER